MIFKQIFKDFLIISPQSYLPRVTASNKTVTIAKVSFNLSREYLETKLTKDLFKHLLHTEAE